MGSLSLWRWLLLTPRRLVRRVRRILRRRRERQELLLSSGRERAILEVVERAKEIAEREAREVQATRLSSRDHDP